MSTNYYRIPTEKEMNQREQDLLTDIDEWDMSPENLERNMRYIPKGDWILMSPWDKFIDDTNIHLGKRSSGWKFIWNFHDNKYYSNKEELFAFIRSGRVVDEYGEEWDVEKFIEMALTWYQPDGWAFNKEYVEEQRKKDNVTHNFGSEYYDKIIDGLVVSRNTDFS